MTRNRRILEDIRAKVAAPVQEPQIEINAEGWTEIDTSGFDKVGQKLLDTFVACQAARNEAKQELDNYLTGKLAGKGYLATGERVISSWKWDKLSVTKDSRMGRKAGTKRSAIRW